MDRRIWIAVLAVIVVVAVAIAVVALNSSGATVVVQEDQSGQTIEVSEGDTLELQLTGNPTTGYNWQTTQIDDAVLTQSGDPSFDPDTELLGSPGVITMTYDTVGAGTRHSHSTTGRSQEGRRKTPSRSRCSSAAEMTTRG